MGNYSGRIGLGNFRLSLRLVCMAGLRVLLVNGRFSRWRFCDVTHRSGTLRMHLHVPAIHV